MSDHTPKKGNAYVIYCRWSCPRRGWVFRFFLGRRSRAARRGYRRRV